MRLAAGTTLTRESGSRICLVVGYIVALMAFVTSPSGQFFIGALAAGCGLIPLLLGPVRYRVFGALLFIIGIAAVVDAFPRFRREIGQYRVRAELTEVINLGTTIGTALDRHRLSARPLPKSIDELGISASREKVANVRIVSEDQFAITLSLPAVASKELIFVATNVDGIRTWKCRSGGVELRVLPPSCRELFDPSIRPGGR